MAEYQTVLIEVPQKEKAKIDRTRYIYIGGICVSLIFTVVFISLTLTKGHDNGVILPTTGFPSFRPTMPSGMPSGMPTFMPTLD